MKFKKWIVLGSVVASLMVVSQSAFADVECKEKKCTPNYGCEIFCKETKK